MHFEVLEYDKLLADRGILSFCQRKVKSSLGAVEVSRQSSSFSTYMTGKIPSENLIGPLLRCCFFRSFVAASCTAPDG